VDSSLLWFSSYSDGLLGEDPVGKRLRFGEGQPVPGSTFPFSGIPPVEVAEPPEPEVRELDEVEEPEDFISWYFFLHRDDGPRLGQQDPHTAFGVFLPYMLDDGILYADGRFLLNDQAGVGGSLNLGRRWHQPEFNRFVGIGLGYDLHQTAFGNTVQQFGLWLESHSYLWDLDLRGHLPVGDRTQQAASPVPASDPFFGGNNLLVDMAQLTERSLGGLELEVSRRVFDSNFWATAGAYHFQGEGAQTYGYSLGFRGYVTENLAAEVAVTNDGLFDTNVFFTFTYFFGGSAEEMFAPADVFLRMAEPVRRRTTVPINQVVDVTTAALTSGGNPITVTHVNDDGVGTGSGTVEDPYGSLTDAAGSSLDIVYLHADSQFSGQNYTLSAGQRLLGESAAVTHDLTTDQLGRIALPKPTGGMGPPQIHDAPGNAVTLASNSEVSGISIYRPEGSGIVADGGITGQVAMGFVDVWHAGSDGIRLSDSGARFRLADVSTHDSLSNGIRLENLAGSVSILRGLAERNVGAGIRASNVNVLAVEGAGALANQAQGVRLDVGGTNVMNATLRNCVAGGNEAASSYGFASNSGAILNLNLFGNEDDLGFQIERDASGFTRLGGVLGQGGFFNDDNGNLANNGNTTGLGPPNVIIAGDGNRIEIIDPAEVPTP
jgi:hypothetical protein